MSVLTPVGIILFSALIMASLQLVPGVLGLFYHSLKGRFNKNLAANIALFFIFGVETALAVTILLLYAIINSSPLIIDALRTEIFDWAAAGLLLATGLAFALAYFRPAKDKTNKNSTHLFLPSKFRAKYLRKIEKVKTRPDAFLLGFTSIIPEFLFTLPLLFLTTIAILALGPTCLPRAWLVLAFILASISPLIVLYILFSRNTTLADYLRFRFNNKSFIRFFIAICYLSLAILIIIGASI